MRQNNIVREGLTIFDKTGHKDATENKYKLANLVYLGNERGGVRSDGLSIRLWQLR